MSRKITSRAGYSGVGFHPGFTLIEVMLSLVILSVMSIMAWKGLDGMLRSRDITEQNVARTLRLHSAMKQFEADLKSLNSTEGMPTLAFSGDTLQMGRKNQGGLQLVVWTLQQGNLFRWAGSPAVTRNQFEAQWEQFTLAESAKKPGLVVLSGIQSWQVYFFRSGAWSNAMSTGDVIETTPENDQDFFTSLPLGVRSVLSMDPTSGLEGKIIRDVMVAPQPRQR